MAPIGVLRGGESGVPPDHEKGRETERARDVKTEQSEPGPRRQRGRRPLDDEDLRAGVGGHVVDRVVPAGGQNVDQDAGGEEDAEERRQRPGGVADQRAEGEAQDADNGEVEPAAR